MAKGASVDLQRDTGATALMVASEKGHREVVEVLVAKGASVDLLARNGVSALMSAERNGHKDVVAVLKAGGKA